MRRAAAVWLVLVLAGCAAAPAPGTAPAPAQAPAPALGNDVSWVRDAAEYQAVVLQTYRAATARVEGQAASRAPGTWAVVLDADETVINNLQYQIERGRLGLGFTPESWNAWVKRREATPIPGAARFLARVRALGGRIAIVTNRLGSECPDTEAVFRAHQLAYDVMLCRPDGTPSDKNPRFTAVERGQAFGLAAPVDVVAVVGDNILDFPGLSQAMRAGGEAAFSEFGVRFFLVPNPMYGSWQ
ncbi:MAG TPA: HAD family acid phosphatase [Vicinamibacterales bacterium]